MARNFSLLVIVMLASCVAFGQTTTPKLNEVKNDPKTTANAARADAQAINKKNMYDSTAFRTLVIKRKEQRAKKRKSLQRRSS